MQTLITVTDLSDSRKKGSHSKQHYIPCPNCGNAPHPPKDRHWWPALAAQTAHCSLVQTSFHMHRDIIQGSISPSSPQHDIIPKFTMTSSPNSQACWDRDVGSSASAIIHRLWLCQFPPHLLKCALSHMDLTLMETLAKSDLRHFYFYLTRWAS